jgi:hypothetical protein
MSVIRTLGSFPPGEPALEVVRHHLVKRRLLRAAPMVSTGRRGAAVLAEAGRAGNAAVEAIMSEPGGVQGT